MKKIFIVKFDNGKIYREDIEEYSFKYCYLSEKQAYEAIEELQESTEILTDYIDCDFDIEDINFWVEELELVD